MLLFLAAALPAPSRAAAKAGFGADEIKMGQEAAKEVERQSKLVTDEKTVSRVVEIGQNLVKASSMPDATFTFKVLDEKDVNAFALPGGIVYLYKGLLDKVESDDELAGVLAHEIVHATHHHGKKVTRKARPYDLATIGVLLAGVFSGKDIGPVAQGVNILGTAAINGYTVDLETEADRDGMDIMLKSRYNPVGMMTFMERLAMDEARSGAGQVELGIFRTHPYTPDRAAAMRKILNEHDIEINRRLVTKSVRVVAEPARIENQDAATLRMDKESIITLSADSGMSAMDRAGAVAEQMNKLLAANLSMREVAANTGSNEVTARGRTVIRVTEADAKLAGKPAAQIAADAANAIRRSLWIEFLRWNS
jgi:predicted Zn-dependent protease